MYRSRVALERTLKAYLEGDRVGFKVVVNNGNDRRLTFLEKLEKFAKVLLATFKLGTRPLSFQNPSITCLNMSHLWAV
jgi:hypothetical protein